MAKTEIKQISKWFISKNFNYIRVYYTDDTVKTYYENINEIWYMLEKLASRKRLII